MSLAARSLLFNIGEERFCLELKRISAVTAWAELEPAGDYRGVLGWLNYRGDRMPVVDLRSVVYGEATVRRLGARILLLECGASTEQGRLVGVLAGEVFSVMEEEPDTPAERLDPCELLSSILLGLR